MTGVVEVLAAVTNDHLLQYWIPAEVNPQSPIFRVFRANLEVLPHLNRLILV